MANTKKFEQKPGNGSLFKNTRKEYEKQPDYAGTFRDFGGKLWRMSAWVKEGKNGKFMSVSLSELMPKSSLPKDAPGDGDRLPW